MIFRELKLGGQIVKIQSLVTSLRLNFNHIISLHAYRRDEELFVTRDIG